MMSNNHTQDHTQNDTEGDSQITEENRDFGTMLSAARKAQNYSIHDIYENIKVPVVVLTALEQCDMAALPAPTFAQGYIRSYARFLEISEDQAIKSYQKALPVKSKPDVILSPNVPAKKSGLSLKINKKTISFALLVVIVLFYTVFQSFNNGDGLEESDVKSDEQPDSPSDGQSDIQSKLQQSIQLSGQQKIKIEQNARLTEDGELIVGQQESISSENVEPEPNESKSSELKLEESKTSEPKTDEQEPVESMAVEGRPIEFDRSESAADQDSMTAATEENETVSATTNDALIEDTISFYAQDGSWLEVWDANEVRLFYDMLPEGASRTLNGQAPFNVFMGNAITSRVEINNIEVDFSARIRTNNTVRFNASITDEQVKFH